MSWEDRLRPAAYVAPDGTRQAFIFEDVSEQLPRKTAAFDSPDADGTYVQDNGVSSRRYPLRCIFSGPDYDLQATAFMDLLAQTGNGTLEHPAYGPKLVVPVGTPTRRDNLRSGANEASVEVEFWETTGLVYPSVELDAAAQIENAVQAYNRAAAEAFTEGLDTSDPLAGNTLRGAITDTVDRTSGALSDAARATDEVFTRFRDIERSIIANLDDTGGQALTLGSQISLFVQEPARAAASIRQRLRDYRALLDTVAGSVPEPGYGSEAQNVFETDRLNAAGAVTGSVLSTLDAEFATRSDAQAAALNVLEQFEDLQAWQDAGYEALGLRDTGGAYSELLNAVALAAGYLVEISFSLRQERALVLQTPRALVELCAELYGNVDDNLDFFITSNSFTGSEILEIPRGRRVVYYV